MVDRNVVAARGVWNLGLVTAVAPNADGRVRRCTVRMVVRDKAIHKAGKVTIEQRITELPVSAANLVLIAGEDGP